jgi:hypothetical protein
MADDVTITVTVNNATGPGITSVNQTINRLSRTAKDGNGAFKDLKATLLSLAPAAVPVAAALAPIAVHAGAAGLAVAAFGAAVVPQIANLKSAATAQTKYTDAVTKYGANSQQAVQAQKLVSDTLAGMPQATQRASAAFSNLQSTFKGFSDSTAKFTMVPVEHSFAVLGEIIPKLTPMVTASATQLDRLVKVAGGAVNSSGFDTLSKKVADYANNSLQRAIDGTIHFARILSEGNAHGPIQSFMDYATPARPGGEGTVHQPRQSGGEPTGGRRTGRPGAAHPGERVREAGCRSTPSLVGTLMSVYSAFRLIKLAGAGIDSIAGGFGRLSARVAELRAVSVAAGGGMAGLNAAMSSLSAGAKFGVVAGGVAALVFALHELSDNKGPVAVDALSRSLNTLVTTGKVTGALKSNFTDISESIAMVSKGASDNKLLQLTSDFGTFIGVSTGPGISTARKNVDAWDKSMANLVRGGHTKEAAAQYEILKKAWVAGGGDLKRLNKFTTTTRARSRTRRSSRNDRPVAWVCSGRRRRTRAAKLDAQKASADGLRQSIQALNDANRAGPRRDDRLRGGHRRAAKAAKDNAGALSMHNGVLNLNSEKAQRGDSAAGPRDKTMTPLREPREAGASVGDRQRDLHRGRAALIKNAEAMGLSKDEAAAACESDPEDPGQDRKRQDERGGREALAWRRSTRR